MQIPQTDRCINKRDDHGVRPTLAAASKNEKPLARQGEVLRVRWAALLPTNVLPTTGRNELATQADRLLEGQQTATICYVQSNVLAPASLKQLMSDFRSIITPLITQLANLHHQQHQKPQQCSRSRSRSRSRQQRQQPHQQQTSYPNWCFNDTTWGNANINSCQPCK